jgi:hypothetical protein
VRVADRVSVQRLLAANFTCECHFGASLQTEEIFDVNRIFILSESEQSRKRFGARREDAQSAGATAN